MTTIEFLSDLRRLDIKVWAENGQLRCSAPKGALTPVLRTELAERKAEILAFLEAAKVATHTAAGPTIPRVPRDGAIALSFAQQRLWFLDQLEPGSSAYNISAALSLVGALDTAVLERSLNQVVQRHETLRTTFVLDNGRPVQRIAPTLTLSMPIIDLAATPAAEREAEIRRWAAEEAHQPFDLATGPLLRVTLLRLAPDEHVLLLTLHHIISDGWSSSVLIRDLIAHYTAQTQGISPELSALPIQYADYAVWQREHLAQGAPGEVLAKQMAYWKQQLRPESTRSLPVLQLPGDPLPASARTGAGASQQLDLSPELTAALKALSQREGSTLFMTLLAAFSTLLARHSEQDDIILGSPIANRNLAQTENLIGLFLNTLALRVNLGGDPSFRELLRRAREVVLDAYAHQDVPFEKLVEEVQPERTLNRHPIFDVLINFNNTPALTMQLPGLELKLLDLTEHESKFTMTLYIQEQAAALSFKLVYQRDRFSDRRMSALLDQLRALLERVVANPDQPISAYSLLTAQMETLLPDPAVALPTPPQELITSRILALAQHDPAREAIAHDGQTWSYGQLAEASQSLARTLLAAGLSHGDRVAITGARSFGLISSLLGVLTGGGVIVPLAQDLPPQRQQVMLEQAGVSVVLLVGPVRPEDDWLRELSGVTTIEVAAEDGRAIELDAALSTSVVSLPQVAPDDAAYVFFTSGTTGVPKGVLGRHRGLAHFLRWQRETFNVRPGDRSAQLTGLSFDVVLRDIFLPLTSGATLCLPGKDDTLGPTRLMPWLERERISILHTVPSLARSWLGNIPDGITLATLRCVFFAGEPLTDTLIARWRSSFPEAGQIVNLYGPTETTLAKCYYPVPDEPTEGVQPVGWPLPETQALVLRPDGELCGIGEPGEIVIRTPFRSLGYINAPDESRQRFRPNPFAQTDAEQDLLYFTGDRGRYRADGALEIIGRVDHQVKIRGARVELGEIEAALSQHPSVRSNVVVVHEDERGESMLVAYVVEGIRRQASGIRGTEADSQPLAPSELRAFLQEKLPSYMVPSIFMLLDALPLSSNGKVNRRALPTPERRSAEQAMAYLAPRSPLEQRIAAIWQEVLHLDKVGMNDNFFELGGHSLLLLEVQVKLQDALGRDISVVDIFQHPTISALAEHIDQAQGAGPSLQQSYDRAEKRKNLQRYKPQSRLKR